MTPPFPEPQLERWQPLRAGLVDLFYYDQEEFWFRSGRLLLRGNNGTGKSKVLALTLPFLLDGDLSPHRVEPDADPKKRMEWNLLLGGDHPHPERLGYTWLEFGRIDDEGEAQFCTIGCGLKAVSGRGIARHWFFVTSRRVGDDLALVDATGTALTRDRLADVLGERGVVYERARDYRRAVDERLFGFGEQRYGAVVDLLVQLRQPQLSKRPSETALSQALTESLPPLDQAVIADVAEAFRSLEEDREQLGAMTEARDSADSFLAHYRHYARIASRRKARLPREAQSVYERIRADLNQAESDLVGAEQRLAGARDRLAGAEAEQVRLQARDAALRESPEMRDARELERIAGDVRRLTQERDRVVGDRNGAAARVADQTQRRTAAEARTASAWERLEATRSAAAESASRARILPDHEDRIAGRLTDPAEVEVLRRTAERITDRQDRAIEHVGALGRAAGQAADELAEARRVLSGFDADLADLAERQAGAVEAVGVRGRELMTAVRAHLASATELRLADPAAMEAALEVWAETLDGPSPAETAVNAAAQATMGDLSTEAAELAAQERSAAARRSELADEIDRLERGEDTLPPVPHTRDASARDGRLGAPLWRLVDFADGLDEDAKAGLEAALEAAGILDAWVTPDGEVVADGTEDILLRRGEAVPANLGQVLRPDVSSEDPQASAVSPDTVADVLASIGYGGEPTHSWVSSGGRFRVGVLEGEWHKTTATFIGRAARDAARRAQLAIVREQLSSVEAQLADLGLAQERVEGRKRVLAREVAELPGDASLRQAHSVVLALADERDRLETRRTGAVADEAARQTAATQAQRELEEAAHETGLPTEAAGLSAVRDALSSYRIALAQLWPALEALRAAELQVEQIASDLADAEGALTDLSERAEGVEQELAAVTERHHTLQDTVGAAVAELERHLAQTAELLQANASERVAARVEMDQAIEARGEANGRKEELSGQLESASERRTEAAEVFRRFAGTGLLAVAIPDVEIPETDSSWAPIPAMRLARRVNDELAGIEDDDNTWDRAQHRLNTELKALQDTLSQHGNRASADLQEDGVVVEVEFQGRATSVPELAEALGTDVADRERLLSEREREVLENHLVNEVASTLQELISAAEAQVSAMNGELESRPTSTGMRLRLLWQPRPDGPAGLAAARDRLLRQTSDAWSADDRSAVGEFLQAQIADVRTRNATGTWLEHLSEALDYRKWNRFVIQRYQNSQWRSATGPASGGERVLAASVPLFAAASSHYSSAGSPHAPRLITLDEAFAGVDDNARAKYLGLLAAFDLDVVMTSEREWGCYPEVPGLAISQLSRADGVPAVLVTNWEWDGTRRTRVDRVVTPSDPEAALREPPQDGLWA